MPFIWQIIPSSIHKTIWTYRARIWIAQYFRTKLKYLDFTQAFCIFDTGFRNTFYDESRSPANRAINPKNVTTNKQMNFTVSTLFIWTRLHVVHVFSILKKMEDPVNGITLWFFGIFLTRFPCSLEIIKSGEASVHGKGTEHTRTSNRTRI